MPIQPRLLRFTSSALGDGERLVPILLRGEEELGLSWSFDLELATRTRDGEVDLAALLREPARLGIRQGDGRGGEGEGIWGWWQGVVAEAALVDPGREWLRYRLRLCSPLFVLGLTRRSRVFLDRSVVDIARSVLGEHGLAGEAVALRLTGSYPQRPHTVQWQESDLAFISRLLERTGIALWSEAGEQATVVLGDHRQAFPLVDGPPVPWRPRPDAAAGAAAPLANQEEVVHSFTCQRTLVPRSVRVADRDWRHPASDPSGRAESQAATTRGAVEDWGDAQTDRDSANALARRRAEVLRSRSADHRGEGDRRDFRAGRIFRLSGAWRSDLDRDYLLTRVEHEARQALERGSGEAGATWYRNRFTALPDDVPFRISERTPWPAIPGLVSASVDAAGDGTYAELDDDGCYRVKPHFDPGEHPAGRGSLPVRMLQPYAGDDLGLHFPLHKKTEVMLAHIGGDPDRPVIAGSLPDAERPSMVTGANQTQARLRTGSGNELRFEDEKGNEEIFLHAVRDQRDRVDHDRSASVGRNDTLLVKLASSETVGAGKQLAVGAGYQVTVGAAMNETVGGAKTEEVGGYKYETVAGNRKLTGNSSFDVSIKQDHRDTAGAQRSIKAKSIVIEADDEIVIRCGKASITLRKSGAIDVEGKGLTIEDKAVTKMTAKKIVQNG